MFSWFNRKKKIEEKKEEKPASKAEAKKGPSPKKQLQPQEPEPENEYEWLIESFVQFLVHPIWKMNINSYIDENCIIFEDVEENQLEHLQCHKEFVKIAESAQDDFMGEMGIDSQTALKSISIGVNIPEYKEIFDQLFLIDNFQAFKKQMVKRNKDLELEALEEQKRQQKEQEYLEQESREQNGNGNREGADSFEYQEEENKTRQEQEKADLDYCIEMSKLQSNDMQRLLGSF